LLRAWNKTGEDEHCDWTFRLDEQRNVLRWDMRQCPSKGFLLNNDLNADEDYCDHCMGWIVPLLERAGVEVAGHEHNHCGQCWGEMRVKGKPYQTLADRPGNIQNDPRWGHGFVERWTEGVKQAERSGLPNISDTSDPAEFLLDYLAEAGCTIVTGAAYAASVEAGVDPTGVVIDDWSSPAELSAIARRFNATAPARRPLLLRAFFPTAVSEGPDPFAASGLPRALPILPLLIRAGVYRHAPGEKPPSSERLTDLLVEAVKITSAIARRPGG
jgi:hypothetical protein